MIDTETSPVRESFDGTDGAGSDAGRRLLRAWRERLSDDPSAGGEAGETESALVDELAVALLYPLDARATASDSALRAARALGGRAAEMDAASLHTRFSHLRSALVIDLLERAGSGSLARERELIETCLNRADELVGPLVAAALDGFNECTPVVDPRNRREERLVQRLRHDIKTPLQAASLNLELLALEHADSASDIEAIETIQASIDQAVDMLRPLDDDVAQR